MSDMDPDKLLDIANRAVRAADAEARGEIEGNRPAVPIWTNPQLDDRAAALQAHLDRRRGRNRSEEEAAEAERRLVEYLKRRYPAQPGDPGYEPVSLREQEDAQYQELCSEIKKRSTYF